MGARPFLIADIGRRLLAVCEYLCVEEFPERDAQALGYAVDVLDGDVAPAGLDFSEVRARHLYRVGERLLAHAKTVSELLDAEPDAHFRTKLSHRHLPFFGTNGSAAHYLSHPYISDNLAYNDLAERLPEEGRTQLRCDPAPMGALACC